MAASQRPIIGADVAPPKETVPQTSPPPQAEDRDMPIARELPPWDLLPSDLLVVRRRKLKK